MEQERNKPCQIDGGRAGEGRGAAGRGARAAGPRPRGLLPAGAEDARPRSGSASVPPQVLGCNKCNFPSITGEVILI